MGDWTADAQVAIGLCTEWASGVQVELPFEIHLFGSAIYKGGEQFDRHTSDLDIVAIFAPELCAVDRVRQLISLQTSKASLELRIIPALGRASCIEPGVSVVPITPFELKANIHKSGARHFFDRNFFLDLRTGNESLGLPKAATVSVPDENRYALEYVQKVRNTYLGKAADLGGGLPLYGGVDPMPKALLRFAAQLNADAADGEWYDTRQGLELLYDKLRERRLEDKLFRDLFDRVSVRRGGRGLRQPLSDVDQLLLGEVLYDIAAAVHVEDVVIWELRFSNPGGFAETDEKRLRQALAQLLPDAVVIDVRTGSLIFSVRSSQRSFDILQRLRILRALPHFFGVGEVDLRLVDGAVANNDLSFRRRDREQRLFDELLLWRPENSLKERALENALEVWLKAAIQKEGLDGSSIVRDPQIMVDDPQLAYGGKRIRPDFVVFWPGEGRNELVAIELTQLRSPSAFFQKLERLLELPYKVLMVVVGSQDHLRTIQDDIIRLGRLSGRVRVVPVPNDS